MDAKRIAVQANGWTETEERSAEENPPKQNQFAEETDSEDKKSNEEKSIELEPTEPPKPPPPPPSGTVSVAGEVKRVLIENKGRDVPVGSVPTGVYTVYATFEGFSEFKVTTLTVKEGGSYTIFCVPTFATCKIK